jgi:hypothetical protein
MFKQGEVKEQGKQEGSTRVGYIDYLYEVLELAMAGLIMSASASTTD